MGDTALQYGLNLVVEAARVAGFSPEPASKGVALATHDVLLVSMYWWEHVYDLVRLVVDAGIDPAKRAPVIVVGGLSPSLNPLSFSPIIHYAVAGDGEAVIGRLLEALDHGETEPDLPGVWWPGKKGPTPAAKAASLMYSPFVHARGLDRLTGKTGKTMGTVRPVTYVEIGRGCPHRCRFCALAHLKPYRELSFDVIKRAIRQAKTKEICLFAPERSSHPAWPEILGECNASGHTDTSSDIRLEKIDSIARVGKVRFGLEGLSSRLRRAVGKPLSRERLAALMQSLSETPSIRQDGHRDCQAWLIGGLPGETEDDYREFAGDLEALNGRIPEDFVLRLTINWFIPQPFTPLQFAPVDPFAEWRKPAWWGVAHGANRSRFKFIVGQKETLAHPVNWLRALIVTRGDKTHWPLVHALETSKAARSIVSNRRTDDLLRLCERAGLPESRLTGELSTSEPLPWELVWSHERAAPDYTRRQWAAYQGVVAGGGG